MRLFTLIRHEIRSLMISPSTYIAMVIALFIMGFFYLFTLLSLTTTENYKQPATLFFSTFWIPALLIVPMLTMRSFAEERKQGTLQSLMTTPVRTYQIVFAKFFGAYAFYVFVWGLSLLFPAGASFVLQQPEMSSRFMDTGSLTGGMIFVSLSGTLFVAVGIFSSSLTRSQLVAGMLSFSIIFMLIVGVAALQFLELDIEQVHLFDKEFINYLQVFDHFEDFSRGLIDSRAFTYYLSGTALILGLSVIVVDSKS